MKKEKINIYVIAEEAGVSPATVSRVITKSARVSKEKERRVREIIEKYEFKPNALAQSLITAQTKTIGLMVSDIRNPFYATMAVECEMAANEKGYTLLLLNSLGDNRLEEAHLEKMSERRADAIIQIGGKVDELFSDDAYVERVNRVTAAIPMLITGKLDGTDCYQINIDEGQSMELVMEYLVGLGHKEIVLVGGRKNVKSTYDKRMRFRQMLRTYGIVFEDRMIVETPHYDVDGGYEGMARILESYDRLPTAVIAINDFTALGIMKAIKQHGLRIPEDISVVSFDNTYLADIGSPRLTSVGYDYRLWGRTIIDTAIGAIQKEEPPRKQLVKSEIVIRDSCRSL